MFATSILLLFCGIPATIALAFILPLNPRNGLEQSDGFLLGLSMICAELLIAGVLHFIADRLSKRWSRIHRANESNVA
jgi:hypothetical protein